MRRYLVGFVVAATLLQAGCVLDTSQLYDGSIPAPPQRWPLNQRICPPGSVVLTSLKLKVTGGGIPFPVKTDGAYSCGVPSTLGPPPPDIRTDSIGSPWGMSGVDNAGGGANFFNVYYGQVLSTNKILNNPRQNSRQNYSPQWSHYAHPTASYPKIWYFNQPINKTVVTVNGLRWEHTTFWKYASLSNDPKAPALPVNRYNLVLGGSVSAPLAIEVRQPEALIALGEVYKHAIDSTHTMLVYAIYERPVVQDAQWLAARRAMLRKLVDTVTITSLTDAQIENYKREAAAYNQSERARECADKRLKLKCH